MVSVKMFVKMDTIMRIHFALIVMKAALNAMVNMKIIVPNAFKAFI